MNSASRTPGHSRGSRSSMFASRTTAWRRRLVAASPGPAGRRSAAPPGRGRRRRCRPARPASAAAPSTRRRGRRRRAAPVGVHISAGDRRRPSTGHPGQQFEHRRAGDRDDAVRAARRAAAQRDRRGASARSRPRCANPATTPTTSASASRAPDLVEVHVLGRRPGARGPRRRRAARTPPGRRRGPPVGRAASVQQRADVGPGAVRRRLRRVHVHPRRAQPVPGDLLASPAGSAPPAARRPRRRGRRAAPRHRRARRAACRPRPRRTGRASRSCR